ncbi:MAG: glycosyltransferase family 4 protein [Lachnospiraceae bacterium]|nr:glycosyltransferase family 4 protein [Lachnospiraceae bacterium]
MKLVFISNYMTHHQLPFCLALEKKLGEEFCFLATDRMEDERKRMGWEQAKYPFIREYDDDWDLSHSLTDESDILICGGTHHSFIEKRLKSGKLTFRYFERLYKKGRQHALSPGGYMRKLKEHTAYRNAPVYLMCAGGYVPADFSMFFSYPGKMLKWGYFPATDETEVYGNRDTLKLLWTGRQLEWKHPETAVLAVRELRDKYGLNTKLTMAGEGEMRGEVERLIKLYDLSDSIELLPFVKPSEVRRLMKEAGIYLMTSSYEEGWGAVVNEAMNAGCVCVASSAAGSVPYLIKDGENGIVYRYEKDALKNAGKIAAAVSRINKDREAAERISAAARETIVKEWNAEHASERFLEFAEGALAGKQLCYESGPMSAAPLIMPGRWP